jgi:sugar phosphate isomerase/epimerase
MRYAFSTLACPAWSIETTVAIATRLGYAGLELRLLDGEVIDPRADRAAVLRAATLAPEAGLVICALDSSCRLNQPEVERRRAERETLRRWIDLAAAADAPVLRVFGGEDEPERPTADGTALASEMLNAVAEEAEAAGVSIALETHDSFSSARRVAEALSSVPSPAMGCLWDILHTHLAGEPPDEVIALLGPRILHVHVKDGSGAEGGLRLTLLGEGEAPLAASLRNLDSIGYHGWISVEWEKKWHPEIADPEVALPQHLGVLRSFERSDSG